MEAHYIYIYLFIILECQCRALLVLETFTVLSRDRSSFVRFFFTQIKLFNKAIIIEKDVLCRIALTGHLRIIQVLNIQVKTYPEIVTYIGLMLKILAFIH